MGVRTEGVRRTWGAVEFRSATEEVGAAARWSLVSDRHILKVLRSGAVSDYAGRIDGGPSGPCAMRAGSVSLIPAGRAYRSEGRGGRIAFSVVSFPGAGEATPLLGHRDEFVHQTVVRIDEALVSGEECLGETLGCALMLHLRSRYVGTPLAEARLDARQKRRLDEYLEANLALRPTVAQLARTVGMGRNGFVAAFRGTFGATPARYVRERRLAEAHRRIGSGPCDLGALALDLGFSSHAHLTTAFKGRYGVPPRDVR